MSLLHFLRRNGRAVLGVQMGAIVVRLAILFGDAFGLAVQHLGEKATQAGAFIERKMTISKLFELTSNSSFSFNLHL